MSLINKLASRILYLKLSHGCALRELQPRCIIYMTAETVIYWFTAGLLSRWRLVRVQNVWASIRTLFLSFSPVPFFLIPFSCFSFFPDPGQSLWRGFRDEWQDVRSTFTLRMLHSQPFNFLRIRVQPCTCVRPLSYSIHVHKLILKKKLFPNMSLQHFVKMRRFLFCILIFWPDIESHARTFVRSSEKASMFLWIVILSAWNNRRFLKCFGTRTAWTQSHYSGQCFIVKRRVDWDYRGKKYRMKKE